MKDSGKRVEVKRIFKKNKVVQLETNNEFINNNYTNASTKKLPIDQTSQNNNINSNTCYISYLYNVFAYQNNTINFLVLQNIIRVVDQNSRAIRK